METELFYYSGTGFTLEAARLLTESLNGKVKMTPIVGVMNSERRQSEAEKIGLLLPMHAFGMPQAFLSFLEEFHFPRAQYCFSLVTRGGAPSLIHREIDRHLKKQRLKLNAFQYADAPNTFSTVFSTHESLPLAQFGDKFTRDVRAFAQVINYEWESIDRGDRKVVLEYILFPLLRELTRLTGYFGLEKDFYTDDNCTGCGICEKMCLSGKIRLRSDRPFWSGDVSCQFCLACLQLCPHQSVQVKKTKSSELPRIYFPQVDRHAIAAQKLPE